MRAHRIKIWPEPFRAVRDEIKWHEIRKADRDYRVLDYLLLCEFDPIKDAATGDYEVRQITYISRAADIPRGLVDGFVVLSILPATLLEREVLLGETRGVINRDVEWVKP